MCRGGPFSVSWSGKGFCWGRGTARLVGHLACLEAVETLIVGIFWGTFAKPRPGWDLVASLNCRTVHPPELVRGICACFWG